MTSANGGGANWANRTIWTGDNLDVMRGMNSASVDLIYLDPPFNSNADYSAPIGSEAAGAEFKDTWGLSDINLAWHGEIKHDHPGLYALLNTTRAIHGDSMMSYLIYMAVRVIEMHRLLKPTGSLYLHCDPTASHYLKLLLDAVFGRAAFRNEIVWKRTTGRRAARHWGNSHDVLLFYSVGTEYTFAPQYGALAASAREHYRHKDDRGTYRLDNVNAPGPNGYHYHLGCGEKPPSKGYRFPREKALEMIEAGVLVVRKGRVPVRKRYLSDSNGTQINTVQTDIPPVVAANKTERVGYPTQKPLALLERIIKASSRCGEIVLDPFAGCATACIAAERSERQWVGIDISPKAADLVAMRLERDIGLFSSVAAHRTDIPMRDDLGDVPAYNSLANRKWLYGEQGGHCNGCAHHFQLKNLTVDHIIPSSKGGTDHISNLQLLCSHCNSVKGDRPMEELLAKLLDKGWIKTQAA